MSTIIQSVIQLVVMAIAQGIEGHLVKPDYMAALITAMMATDRLFDQVTILLEACFESDDEDEVNMGQMANALFKLLHNTALVILALFLSNYSQDLYFFIENEEIANLELLTDSKYWFNNQTTTGTLDDGFEYDFSGYYDFLDDEDGKIDGPDATESANYCTSDPSPWNKLGYTVKRVHCSKYDGETGTFEDPQEFPTFFTDQFNPGNGKDWGKMKALWGDVTTNYCPEQCSTDSVFFTKAHPCDPTLCNFYKITKNGDTETASREMPRMLQPFRDDLEMGESVQDETEKLLTDL